MGFFITLILFAATFVLSEFLKPKPNIENARPSGLGDFNFPTATEERFVPIIWGTVKLEGPNVIWYGDLRQRAITESVKTGLFSSESVTRGYRYFIGIQMALCRGSGSASAPEQFELRRIFVDDEEIFNGSQGEGTIDIVLPRLFGGSQLGNGGLRGTISVRIGTETQTAPTYLTEFQQAPNGDTPGYRGTAFVTWEGGYIGNSTNIAPWSFEGRRIPNGLGLSTPTVNSGNDLNPMNAVYELMTNDEWGLGFPPSDIDIAAFTAAADTLETEGNGVSFVWDRERDVSDILRELERQIDGVIYLDRSTGKWSVILARGGYDINSIPQIGESDVIEMSNLARGAWEDTQNFVKIQFNHRGREYQGTYAPAVDHGNIFIQGGDVKHSVLQYPMVKDPALANSIAWRELRTLSFPLAKVKLTVDRKFAALNPGNVIAWTDSDLGYNQLAMRINRVDLGNLQSGVVTLDLVQDVFTFEDPSFATPSDGDWDPPTNTMQPVPAIDSAVFEAPRAFLTRDGSSPDVARIWAGARNQGDGAASINILERHSSGAPSGPFSAAGSTFAFIEIGELDSDIGYGSTDGVTNATITIVPNPSTQDLILDALDPASDEDIGVSLSNLALVDGELIGFQSAVANGSDIDLQNVHRGLLDTAQGPRAKDTRVFLIAAGGNMTSTVFPAGDIVDIKLQTTSTTDTLAEGDAPTIQVDLDNRALRPYLPSRMQANNSFWPSSVSVDASLIGAGVDERGIRFDLTRRDFRLTDEVGSLTQDATVEFTGFPGSNSTVYLITVVADPSGANTTLFTTDPLGDEEQPVLRLDILSNNAGVLPTELGVRVRTRHTVSGVIYDSLDTLDFDFTVSSDLFDGDALGLLDTNDIAAAFTMSIAGGLDLNVGAALSGGGIVEARVNGGAFSTVISSGNTSGSLAGLSMGDSIEIRHTVPTASFETTLIATNDSAGVEAYAVLFS